MRSRSDRRLAEAKCHAPCALKASFQIYGRCHCTCAPMAPCPNQTITTVKKIKTAARTVFIFLAMDDKKDIFVFFRLGLNCRVIKAYSFLRQSKSRTYYNIIILLLLIALHKEVMHSTISTASLFLIFVSVCTILLRILKYSLAL